MERLTKRDGILARPAFLRDYGSANILGRLADYEDSGLEPEQISSLLSDNKNLIETCKKLQADNSRLKMQLGKGVSKERIDEDA